jgi:hypothetical protein
VDVHQQSLREAGLASKKPETDGCLFNDGMAIENDPLPANARKDADIMAKVRRVAREAQEAPGAQE